MMPAPDDEPTAPASLDGGDTSRTPLQPTAASGAGGAGQVQGAAASGGSLRPARGDRLGTYVLIDRIGGGTYGEVWKADQREPVRREVAVKVLNPGMHSASILARFAAEQQALAMMDHPGIARVFDAGVAPSGLPYFVMQYVKGDTLLSYCDREKLTLNERLELFAGICDAVHHAHQKGIIHRDLKPSNIVVTTGGDGKAQPVVVDFGVAKALTQSLTDATVYSVLGGPQGTWAYMSPEQAEGLADIDTRSDVYSLGVVLYELLSGLRPFDDDTLIAAGEAGRRRLILEKEPPSPGDRLETDPTGTGTRSAERRRIDLSELSKALRGELSWIPLYAMRKERRQRYNSASQFAEDVRNYLAGRPLIAGPESAGYRAAKFVRRNRLLVGATAAVILSLSVGLGLAYWQWGVAVDQAIRADANAIVAAHERDAAWLARERAERATRDADAARIAIERNAYVANVQMAGAALDARRFILARERIDSCPLALRGWEWNWVQREADQSLIELKGHTKSLRSAMFSPDGMRVATASEDGTARVWDAATGGFGAELRGHARGITSIAFSPDGTRLATASWDGTARIWDAATGAAVTNALVHDGFVLAVAFSPDGTRVVTTSADKTARVWNAATGATAATLKGHAEWVTCAVFSPDGTRVATASADKTARVWNAATGATIAELIGHSESVNCVAFSADGFRMFTASEDKTARIWNSETGDLIAELSGHASGIVAASFSPDGNRVVTASSDKTARIWDGNTGTLLTELRGHTGGLTSAAFSADGAHIVTASRDATARIWDAANGSAVAELRGHIDAVCSAAFSLDGSRIVTASSDTTSRIWDTATGATIVELGDRHLPRGGPAAFSPDGRRIATISPDNIARVWDPTTGTVVAEIAGHAKSLSSSAFSPDGSRVVTASDDKTAAIWNAGTGAAVATLKGHTESVISASFSPDGTHVVTASCDATARVWDAASGRIIATLGGHDEKLSSAAAGTGVVPTTLDAIDLFLRAVSGGSTGQRTVHRTDLASASFSPDGTRVVTAVGTTAHIWDVASGGLVAELSGHAGSLSSAAFSSKGTRVVTASADTTARVWDATTGAIVSELVGHKDQLRSAAFSPDGGRVVTASDDGTSRVWDSVSGSLIAELRGHARGVTTAAFSPDGTRVVTASWDGTANIWDAETGAVMAVLRASPPDTDSAAFSPDGTRIVTATANDGTARIWDSIPHRIRLAERLANARGEEGGAIVRAYLAEVRSSGPATYLTDPSLPVPPMFFADPDMTRAPGQRPSSPANASSARSR